MMIRNCARLSWKSHSLGTTGLRPEGEPARVSWSLVKVGSRDPTSKIGLERAREDNVRKTSNYRAGEVY